MKITRQTIIPALLIFLAIFFGHTTETGFSIGDKILLALGISPWSNGQTGFHYPAIIYFVLLTIGCIEARRIMPFRKVVILLLILSILTPSVVSFVKPYYYRMHSGLGSVEYDLRNSSFNMNGSNDNKNMEIQGAIVLTNHGKDSIEFGIKLPADNAFVKEWFSQDLILTQAGNPERAGGFILYPGEKRTILSYNSMALKDSYNGHGSMRGPNLILYTQDETRVVGDNL